MFYSLLYRNKHLKFLFSTKVIFIILFVSFQISSIQGSLNKNLTNSKAYNDSQGLLNSLPNSKLPKDNDWITWDFTRESNCSNGSSESFPDDIFTEEQLKQGAVILHFIGGVYSFTLLAVVCNDYFIPAVECICDDLHLSQDVAAATFMAVATSSPELFINIMSTFVTESDLGIGTIVGSAMFNTLGVGAIGGLAASKAIPIKKWPLMRDCIIYCIVVAILVTMTWDDRIEWWECSILLTLYILYFVFMFNNKRIIKFFSNIFCKKSGQSGFNVDKKSEDDEDYNRYTARVSIILSKRRSTQLSRRSKSIDLSEIEENVDEEEVKSRKSLWRYPKDKSATKQAWFLYTWLIKLILTCIIPSPKTWRKLYPLTFIMCIVAIGLNSYFVSWMITVIGDTLGIPDTIMGMTFLAFGGCLPEACSIFIMSRRGEGGMGVSNALGANSLAILFSLGIPWFVKSMILRSQGKDGFIEVASAGMDYIILSLIFAVISLYVVLSLGKFELKKSIGAIIMLFYIVFIVLAILMESGIFFEVHEPCIA